MADNMKEIYCPACGKKMEKVFMDKQNLYLDVCLNGCGGIYFDNREFYKFDENSEDISPLIKVLENKEFAKTDETAQRICPVCGMKMVKNVMKSSNVNIEVDDCYSCGGKFIDNKELQAIRNQYPTENERIEAALKDVYFNIGKELHKIQLEYEGHMKKPSLTMKAVQKQLKRNEERLNNITQKAMDYVNKNLE